MPDTAARVINYLYRPPESGRQVFALPRGEAERLPLIAGVAIISITAPEKPQARLQNFSHILRLSFADVDFNSPDITARAREKLPYAFSKEDARRIVKFVSALPAEVHSIVVHCEGGYSRSCAVALFIHLQYGAATEVARLSERNKSILALLQQVQKNRYY